MKNSCKDGPSWRLVLLERASLFAALYVVTVSLFWFETGLLSKGLMFGLIAAGLKTGIATGHARFFGRFEELNSATCHSCLRNNEERRSTDFTEPACEGAVS
jgi:hypothetical protein